MKKFTITALKKELSQKTKEELVKEITTLCQTFPQVKEYYKAQGSDINELLDKYKAIIEAEFIEGRTKGFPKLRFSVARKAITDFKKLTNDVELIADISFTYVESISWFNNMYNPDVEDFYVRPENMFEDTLKLIKQHGLQDKFKNRAYEIVENVTDGMGHNELLQGSYEDIYGNFIK